MPINSQRRGLADIKSQLASEHGQLATQHDRPDDHAKQSESDGQLNDGEAARAADAERRKEFMVGVAEGFSNERVDGVWAGRTASRIGTALDSDDVLRGIAHRVECRWQTCRVELDDDGSGRLSSRMPFIALGLADVLPGMNAEQVTRADGRIATVLYLSNAQPASASTK